MVGGRERFIAYNSARRGSPELKLGGPVGLVVPVRTPDSGAVRFMSYGSTLPELRGAVPPGPEGLSTRGWIEGLEIYRTSPGSRRSAAARASSFYLADVGIC